MQLNNLIRISAAGSGKTWGICHDALSIAANPQFQSRILMITYTNKGVSTIKETIKKQNDGILSRKIIICSWYQFLLTELIRPYQTYICGINEIKSFDFSHMYGSRAINYGSKGQKFRYINSHGYVLANQASELACLLNKRSIGSVIHRLELIYPYIFVDEVQDLAGYDLDILDMIMTVNIGIVCVGDNKQATYKTHNTKKRIKQSGKNIWDFFINEQQHGRVKIEQQLVSRRFNNSICLFANAIYPNANNITTRMAEKTEHDGVFLIARDDVRRYSLYFKPVVLKYDNRTNTEGYPSFNFGGCKGETFDRIIIFPNKPLINFVLKSEKLKAPEKYYVAVTRPRYSLAIVLDELPQSILSFSLTKVKINGKKMQLMQFVSKI